MCIVLKLIIESDDNSRVVNEREILRIERSVESTIAPIGLGLTLLEAKTMLAATQKEVVALQAEQIITQASHCTDCGAVLKIKDTRQLVYRTLLGKLRLRSPRMLTCSCQAGSSIRSFSPLANALTERSHPELQYLTTRWASIMSYGASSALLDEILPIGAAMSCSSVRNAVLRVGQRMDAETAMPKAHMQGSSARSGREHIALTATIRLPSNWMQATYVAMTDPKKGRAGSARRLRVWSGPRVPACAMDL